MSEKQIVELTSPDGQRTWSTTNALELTNLRARGWAEKPPVDVDPVQALADEPAPPANKATSSKLHK